MQDGGVGVGEKGDFILTAVTNGVLAGTRNRVYLNAPSIYDYVIYALFAWGGTRERVLLCQLLHPRVQELGGPHSTVQRTAGHPRPLSYSRFCCCTWGHVLIIFNSWAYHKLLTDKPTTHLLLWCACWFLFFPSFLSVTTPRLAFASCWDSIPAPCSCTVHRQPKSFDQIYYILKKQFQKLNLFIK